MPKRMIDCALASITTAHDLLSLCDESEDIRFGWTAVILQQATEMSLKAIMEDIGMRTEDSEHDIFDCYKKVKICQPDLLPEEMEEFLRYRGYVVSDFYISGRYSSYFDIFKAELQYYYKLILKLYNLAAEFCDGTQYFPD